jgi:protein-S-isoprenylcysteine O-methyltransferase Ste14
MADRITDSTSWLRGLINILGVGPLLLMLGLLLEGLTLLAWRFISFPVSLPLWLQVGLTALCGAIALAGGIWFNRTLDLVGVNLRNKKPQLVTHGPFNYVRHPLYAVLMLTLPPLFILWYSDLVFFAPWVLIYALAAPVVWVEEKGLVETFGEAYQIYRRCVPAFLPYKGAGGRRYLELSPGSKRLKETPEQ